MEVFHSLRQGGAQFLDARDLHQGLSDSPLGSVPPAIRPPQETMQMLSTHTHKRLCAHTVSWSVGQ